MSKMKKIPKEISIRKAIACVVITALVVGSGVYFAVRPAPEKLVNPIKIGVVGPMEFIQGEHHWHGAEMAAREINAKGGIKVGDVWRPIELVKIDSKGITSPGEAPGALEEAITREGIDFVIGGFRTEAVFGMQEVAMDHKMIFLGCGSATDELCTHVGEDYERYKYWFRVTPIKSTDLGALDFRLLGTVGTYMVIAGIEPPLKVAILAEDAVWANAIVEAAQTYIPLFGVAGYPFENVVPMEIVGTWRPSATATDVTAELTDIAAHDPHMIFTTISGPVGIPYAKSWGELEITAASVGINVEAQKAGFWDATGGKGNYELTLNTYAHIPITPATIPFYETFEHEMGEFPTYNAGTYEAIYMLAEAITRTGTLDSDVLVEELEKTGTRNLTQYYRPGLPDGVGTAGRIVYDETHDITWGPWASWEELYEGGYVTGLGTQWQDGELKCVWPLMDPVFGTIEGTVPYILPPRVIEHWT